MTTQSDVTYGDLYNAIQGNSEEIDRAHGRLDQMNKRLEGVENRLGNVENRLEGVENVLIAVANSLGVKTDYLPESKIISLSERRQRV